MPISTGLFSSILVLGVGQGLLLAALLVRRSRSTAHVLLAALMLAYAVFLVQELLYAAELQTTYPRLVILSAAMPLLFGPLHYLFARYLTDPGRPFRPLVWLNFLPFVIVRISLLPLTFASSDGIAEVLVMERTGEHSVSNLVFGGLTAAHGLTYMILTLALLARIRHDRAQDAQRVNWLRQITWLAFVVWVVVAIQVILLPFGVDLFRATLSPIGLLTGIVVYATGYLGLRKAGDFLVETARPAGASAPAYSRSGLSQQAARRHLADLVTLMEEEKPFRKSTLTLQQLADRLEVSRHHLSEVLNAERGESFFDFVNAYRVDEVKRMLEDRSYEQLTLMAIAEEAGFSSKSTFNESFKRATGMTPSVYRERLRGRDPS